MKLGGSLKRDLDESRIMMMYRSGATIRQISQALDVPRATLYNRIAMLEAA
jgi:transposase-like protein